MGIDTIQAMRATFEAILAGRGYELVELTLAREGRRLMLRVTVDRPEGGVGLEDVTEISEVLSRALDEEDPIPGPYTLEVASPGIERPLVRPSDYLRFEGREIRVKTREGIEGRRRFQGVIESSSEDSFVLRLDDGSVVEIPYTSVAEAKLVVDWDAELKRANRTNGGGKP
jgi:ribosome maturation factor RimP